VSDAPSRARLEPLRGDRRRHQHAAFVAALLLYGALIEAAVIVETVRAGAISSKHGKSLALGLIEATDIFLIGIVLFIFRLALYVLFIDDRLPRPAWLKVQNLDDLKGQLVSVVIAALAVNFLGHVVQWEGSPTSSDSAQRSR
jgi:uncharacterized membrane protein YqhA